MTSPTDQTEPTSSQFPLSTPTTPTRTPRRIYTIRDHDAVAILLAYAEEDEHGKFVGISNSQLAKELGVSTSAAAARLLRLESMGVVSLNYITDQRTGRFVSRMIVVNEIPPTPWVPGREDPHAS